jgi:tRNA dimethylallyltransferase
LAGARIRVICGPTAAGKTALALELAERFGLSIISADSRQIYRGFDVGTAKPAAQERRGVPHYGLDILDPTERYSAASFARDAERWIAEEDAEGRDVIVVGGTGFYIRALVDPLADSPAFETAQRRTLASELEDLSTDELRRWCELLDPGLAHLGRTQLLRAVETALLSGRRLSEFQARGPAAEVRPAAYLLVDPGASVLKQRIEQRLDEMLAAGWLDEVRELEPKVPIGSPAWSGTGYQFMRSVVRGEMDPDTARSLTLTATKQYAKRQRTWFRHQVAAADLTQLDPTAPDALELACKWVEKHG